MLCDRLKNLTSLSKPIEVKPKPIVTCLHEFSCNWHLLHVFALSSDWLFRLSVSTVIGKSNYFGFGFTTLK